MRGARAHAGWPEKAYAKFSQILVEKGYRVARIEQTETPAMLKVANSKCAKGSKRKVVAREICALLTPGTRTNGVMDQRGGIKMYGKNAPKGTAESGYDGIKEGDAPTYLLGIFEQESAAKREAAETEASKKNITKSSKPCFFNTNHRKTCIFEVV